MRHGTATMLLAAGQPIKVISEILGHATSAFTADVYTIRGCRGAGRRRRIGDRRLCATGGSAANRQSWTSGMNAQLS